MSKILTVHPDLFKISGARRSRKQTKPDNEIKVRAPREPKKQTLTNKNALLRFIRDQQHRNERTHDVGHAEDIDEQIVANDFDDSLKFLMDIANKVDTQPATQAQAQHVPVHNYTLKSSHSSGGHSSSDRWGMDHPMSNILPDTNVSMIFPGGGGDGGNVLKLAAPTYGCLKGGTKPTYRQYYQLYGGGRADPTHSPQQLYGGGRADPTHSPRQLNSPHVTAMTPQHPHNLTQRYRPSDMQHRPPSEMQVQSNHRFHDQIRRGEVDRKVTDLVKSANQPSASKLIYPKQKRTVRRTFKIGKSKTHPKVSVLVSNRTIRRTITTKSHELKQTSMHDIKLFLIKRGLIRVGTSAPNNVLRQMYESATLLCGDVYNHNQDTLLYNFFNDESVQKH